MDVVAFGEVLVDMISSRVTHNDPAAEDRFVPIAGGAPANVAVAVAKLGGDSKFAGGVSSDRFGGFLVGELARHGVETSQCQVSERKTALAFVSLDDEGERSFDFYGDNAAHLHFDPAGASLGDEPVILHVSSNTMIAPPIRHATSELITKACQSGGIASFDINYRKGLWEDPRSAPDAVDELARLCQVIKASREELLELYGNLSESVLQGWLEAGVRLLVVTDGSNDLEYFHRSTRRKLPTPRVQAVDTTAAGDAFVGGLLYRLSSLLDDHSLDDCDADLIADAVAFASRCGAFAVTRAGAFPSLPSLDDLSAIQV